MRQPVTYGFFGEDAAQQHFLSSYLDKQYPAMFAKSDEFSWRIKARNKDQVDSRLPDALLVRRDLRLDVLFVGRDSDSSDPKSIQICTERLSNMCKGQPPVVFMIPVQCIEHWLWYLKRHQENSGVNKPLETHKRTEAKNEVYGDVLTEVKRLGKLDLLMVNFDADWLESRSVSFRIFHQEIKKYVNENYAITPS